MHRCGLWVKGYLLLALISLVGCRSGDSSRYAETERPLVQGAQDDMKHAVEGAADKRDYAVRDLPKIPADLAPWWEKQVGEKLYQSADTQPCTLDDLYVRTLVHSSQIQAFADLPLIRETGVQEAEGRFDVHAFLDSKYEETNEPVASLLTSQTRDIFHEHVTSGEGGIKWHAPTGADISFSERLTRTSSNSEFLSPDPQSQARLTLSIVQPILKGGGVAYNRSTIYIAEIDGEVARAEFIRQAESHLLSVCTAYWGLYQARSEFVIRRKLVEDTDKLVTKLKERKNLDIAKVQLVRAESALAARKVSLVRTELAIKNAEDRVRALVNDNDLRRTSTLELLPSTALSLTEAPLDAGTAAANAVQHRPEIEQGIAQLRAAAVREDVAKSELMPQLNLLLEGSLRGLDEGTQVGDAMGDSPDHTSFMFGLSFDYPLGNNEARARYTRRKLETRQQLRQMRVAVETVMLEVKIAVREMATAYRELQGKYAALLAAQEDLRTLEERWGIDAGAGGAAGASYLDLLVDAQGRVSAADEEVMRSAVQYNLALMTVQRAQGTLLQYLNIEPARVNGPDELPEFILKKAGPQPPPK